MAFFRIALTLLITFATAPAFPMSFQMVEACQNSTCPGVAVGIGKIDESTPEMLRQFILNHPSLRTIYLHSPGGIAVAGMKSGEILRVFGINTRVHSSGECYSSCALMFMGGRNRSIDEGGRIGVHRAAMEDISDLDFSDGLAMGQHFASILARYAESMGVSRSIIELGLQKSSQQIHIIDQQTSIGSRLSNSRGRVNKWTLTLKDGTMIATTDGAAVGSDHKVLLIVSRTFNEVFYLHPPSKWPEQNTMKPRKVCKFAFTHNNLFARVDGNYQVGQSREIRNKKSPCFHGALTVSWPCNDNTMELHHLYSAAATMPLNCWSTWSPFLRHSTKPSLRQMNM